MGGIIILNGSPRAPKSNSKGYAQLFARYSALPTSYFEITGSNHPQLCAGLADCKHVLLVFPLYADGIPVTLLNFLKFLEQSSLKNRPVISALINCGFLEPHQCDVAADMIRLFCAQNGYPAGSILKVGSGEAILDSPFRFLAAGSVKKLARSIAREEYGAFQTTMPLSKGMFLSASTKYWLSLGRKNGVTQQQMQSMEIEP